MNTILTQKQGNILLIGLNRPQERNRFNRELLIQLSDAYTLMEDDPEIRCAVLYAQGKHFTLGLQLDEVAKMVKEGAGWPIPEGNIDPWGGYESAPQ